jgi:hypothetical protein
MRGWLMRREVESFWYKGDDGDFSYCTIIPEKFSYRGERRGHEGPGSVIISPSQRLRFEWLILSLTRNE